MRHFKRNRKTKLTGSVLALALVTACSQSAPAPSQPSSEAPASDSGQTQGAETQVQDVPEGFAIRPLWGDTHLHTSYSFDVYLFGTPASTPEGAYRFARGEAVTSPTTGETWQLDRPLDFLVVSDHAEALGSAKRNFESDQTIASTASGQAMLNLATRDEGEVTDEGLLKAYHYLQTVGTGAAEDTEFGLTPIDLYLDLHAGDKRDSAWFDIIDTADRFNAPGEFTAFIGWEWTSHPGGANLHRNVFTPVGADIARTFRPFSSTESMRPEDLWAWLVKTRDETGADFIAIPHNPNVSAGLMFQFEDSDGNPIDADYASRRAEWERIVEMTQIKGDSETHPRLSPTDEFADFETWNFVMLPNGPTPDPVASEYVRSALRRGLEIEARTGVNPYQFGMIGSTDSHTGLSTSSETAFAGKGQKDSRPALRGNKTGLGSSRGWDMGAAGLVAVWSPTNTRQAIFDTFKRREVYATTGTRISLRVLAGEDLSLDDLTSATTLADAYQSATPMGGEISGADAPQILVQALKDPDGANLDRVQIVKGWVDGSGTTHESIFDVAWSDQRSMNEEGKLEAVGNTVDLETGAYENTIGAPVLSALWSDPEFDASQSAFYYVRVLEIPTPRYSLLNALERGIPVENTRRPATLQERAYSSPIWFKPGTE